NPALVPFRTAAAPDRGDLMHRARTATTLAVLALTLFAPACGRDDAHAPSSGAPSPSAVDAGTAPALAPAPGALAAPAASCPFPIVVDGDEVDDLERIPQ